MHGGGSYLPEDDILPPSAKDMIDDIREESDDDADMQWPKRRSFLMKKPGCHMVERQLQRRIIMQQR